MPSEIDEESSTEWPRISEADDDGMLASCVESDHPAPDAEAEQELSSLEIEERKDDVVTASPAAKKAAISSGEEAGEVEFENCPEDEQDASADDDDEDEDEEISAAEEEEEVGEEESEKEEAGVDA